jgi:UDP-N-acetylglucosamine 2-epimerase (non-hydrolysing)
MMDSVFFEELGLPQPKYNLHVGSGSHARQTGRILMRIDDILHEEQPDIVVVQGDTNTVLAGALAASKMNLPVGHLESGLRSFDRTMPEETNRILADHMANQLYAPTSLSLQHLASEGIDGRGVYKTGNTAVDSLQRNIPAARKKSDVMGRLDISKKRFIAVTAHRPDNVDNQKNLTGILSALERVAKESGLPIIFPAHPRTQKMMRKFRLKPKGVQVIDPVSYWDFLVLEDNAACVLTDSGGVQEETCVLRTPCVTLRWNTERQETLEGGMNTLVGNDPKKIVPATLKALSFKGPWSSPFGKGDAGVKTVQYIHEGEWRQ